MATPPLPRCPFSCTSLSRKAASSGVTCVCSRRLAPVLTGVPRSCGGERLPPRTCLFTRPPLPRGEGWLSAVGFLRVIIMLVFLPSCLSLSLLLPETPRGLGQPPPRQGGGRRLRHWDRWPGFRDEAAQGQRGLVEQGHQEQVPAPAKDTHQPQAGGTPRPRRPGDQGRDVRDGADWDRLLGLAPNAQQPQGGYGHGQPQARGPVGLRHVRALPRPAGA